MNRAAAPLRQDTRGIRLATPLPEGAIGLRRVRVREALGEMFSIEAEAVAADPEFDHDALLSGNVTVTVETSDPDAPRHFNGFVTEAALGEPVDGGVALSFVAAPWLWFLTLRQTCRIFEGKSVPDIIEAVLGEHNLGLHRLELRGEHPALPYAVQYNESDFALLSRLMERDGIYYAFEHENGAHTLVLHDDVAGLPENPAMPRYAFRADKAGDARQGHGVTLWRPARRLRPGRVYLRDYNPATPGADLGAEGSAGQTDPAWEVAAYPGGHADAAGGRRRARIFAEALQADAARIEAATDLREVRAGDRFTLEGHPVARENAAHYVVEAVHDATAPGYVTGQALEERFETRFVAARRDVPFRPPRRTPWPRIAGVQTAMVTGDAGAEITPHAHVAVRVSFHWLPGAPSCRVRVGQLWVGAGFGAMAIPRIGDEVIVTFEEGDPDRPLIVGSLYNAAAKPPYDPVETPDVVAFRSNSTPGGGGSNELRFRDKAGEETVLLQAQRDLDVHVKNDARESVLGERHASVAKDDLLKVEGDSHAETLGDSAEKVGGNRALTVGGDAFAAAGGARHDDVGGEWRLTAGGDIGVDAGGSLLLASGSATVIQSGAAFHLKAGAAMVIEGASQLSLKVGGSFVDIGPSGVSISGPMVKINSGGAAGSGAGTKPQAAKAPNAPKAPKAAATAEAGAAPPAPQARPRPLTPAELDANPTAAALRAAHESGAPFCEQCEAAKRAGGAA